MAKVTRGSNGKASANGNGHTHDPFDVTLMPPEAKYAEEVVLGSMLLSEIAIDQVSETLKPEHFRIVVHQEAFRGMVDLRGKGKATDAVTVAEFLAKKGLLADAGGAEGIGGWMDNVPHSAHARHYAGIVRTAFLRRSLIHLCGELAENARNETLDISDTLAHGESGINGLLQEEVREEPVDLQTVLLDALELLDSPKRVGVKTGFVDLDSILNGMQAGNLLILAARPSVGKTALAGNIGTNVARHGVPVLFCSLEQSRLEVAHRVLCSESGVDSHAFRGGNLTDEERHALMEASNVCGQWPLMIDERPTRSVSQIGAAARLRRRQKRIGLLIVDYLQLVQPENQKDPREQQIARITRSLKQLARALEIPVLALAQLNRAIETRTDKRPKLSDLRESGAIEQDADVVMFLDRPHMYDERADEEQKRIGMVYVSKHRNGRTGDVPLNWDASTMTFRNHAKDYQVNGSRYQTWEPGKKMEI